MLVQRLIQNALISRLFGVFARGFLDRTTLLILKNHFQHVFAKKKVENNLPILHGLQTYQNNGFSRQRLPTMPQRTPKVPWLQFISQAISTPQSRSITTTLGTKTLSVCFQPTLLNFKHLLSTMQPNPRGTLFFVTYAMIRLLLVLN